MSDVRYDRATAIQLADDLVDLAARLREMAAKMPTEGPLVDLFCQRVGVAISELQTTVRM